MRLRATRLAAISAGRAIAQAATVVADAFWRNVTLLLRTTNTNGAQNNTFLDSSPNAFAITRNGNVTQGAFSPFSQTGWSVYFSNTNYTNIYAASSADFNFGSGDFTIECFFNPTYIPPSGDSTFTRLFDTGQLSCFFYNGTIYFRNAASAELAAPIAHGLAVGNWYHLAFVRSGTTYLIFRDGVQLTSGSGGAITSVSAPFVIGTNSSYNQQLVGHVSNFRITTGQALYTSAFTAPTSPLTTVSQGAVAANVKLLTCQSNRFIDNSTQNTKTILLGDGGANQGSRFIQPFSPFQPSSAWSAGTNGGGGYFDGTGDYLSVPDNAALDLGSSNFTIELFAYYVSSGGGSGRGTLSKGTTTGASFLIFQGSGNELSFYASSNGSSWDIASNVQFTASLPLGAWHHIAVTRSGSTFRLFFNGALSTSFTNASALVDNSATLDIGAHGALAANAYISSLRIIKGAAQYTSAFTPPTAPLAAIANTSLLLNFANGGVFDATTKTALETVGNAQASTTQARFGASSMFFDGTGDYLTAPNSPNYALGPGNWTVEAWLYPTATGVQFWYDTRTSTSTGFDLILGTNSSNFPLIFVNGAILFTSSTALAVNAWSHVALVRSAGVITLYINGVKPTTGSAASAVNFTAQGCTVGTAFDDRTATASSKFAGYIDGLRVTKGIARYTADFTPPTTAFPAQ